MDCLSSLSNQKKEKKEALVTLVSSLLLRQRQFGMYLRPSWRRISKLRVSVWRVLELVRMKVYSGSIAEL